MTWVFLALIPPFLFAGCNYIDKLVLSKIFPNSGPGVFILATSIVSACMSLVALAIAPQALHLDASTAIMIALNGVLFMLGIIPYIVALSRANTSEVAPLFQLRHGIVLLLAFLFLGELPTNLQLLGMVVTCLGVLIISFESSTRGGLRSQRVLPLMILASTCLAMYMVMFKRLQLDSGFWPTKFWEYLGEAFFAAGFALSPKTRMALALAWREHRSRMISPLLGTELLNVIGGLVFTYALTLGPAALVSTLAGTHPLVVILFGYVLGRRTVFYRAESVSMSTLVRRVLGALATVVGCVMMGLS